MVHPVLRSENWNFLRGRTSGPQCSDCNMAASARLEANLMNSVQESGEKDEIKPKKYVIMTDITRSR